MKSFKVILFVVSMIMVLVPYTQGCEHVTKKLNEAFKNKNGDISTIFNINIQQPWSALKKIIGCYKEYAESPSPLIEGQRLNLSFLGNIIRAIETQINQKDLSKLSEQNLLIRFNNLIKIETELNEKYTGYMKIIYASAPVQKKVEKTDPDLIFPGYETLLSPYAKYKQSNKNLMLDTSQIIQFLKSVHVIDEDRLRDVRSAEKLYSRLQRLEDSLVQANGSFGWLINKKRTEQIKQIKEIKNALVKHFTPVVVGTSGVPPMVYSMLATSKEKRAVVTVALLANLHTITRFLENEIIQMLEEKTAS